MITENETIDAWPREARMVAMDLVEQVAKLHETNTKLQTLVRELSKRLLEKND